MNRTLLTATLLLVVGLLFQCAASASTLNINPVTFDLGAPRFAGLLKVTNSGDAPVRMQVSAVDWHVTAEEQKEESTGDLIVNPPIFSLFPGQTQFIRFGLRAPGHETSERTYRLILEEVPDAQNLDHDGAALRTLLRFSLPVFIGALAPHRSVAWSLTRSDKGMPQLEAQNEGNTHVKILSLLLRNADDYQQRFNSNALYLLPGQRRTWPLPGKELPAGALRLLVTTDRSETEEQLERHAAPQ